MPANAQLRLVAAGERGRYQVFIGRGRAHGEKRALSQRRELLAQLFEGLPLVRCQCETQAEPLQLAGER